MTRIEMLPSANEAWGFFGTMRGHADPAEAWGSALPRIMRATGCPAEAVRDFLDSRHGRHFADDVVNGLFAGLALDRAVDQAIARWMGWRIGRRTAAETGIPEGLPYLTGFVMDREVAAMS